MKRLLNRLKSKLPDAIIDYWKNKGEKGQDNIILFLWTLFGNLAPLIIGILFLIFPISSEVGISDFYKDGQFYIYAVTLLAGASYWFYTFKVLNRGKNSLYLIISILLIALSSFLYAFLISGDLIGKLFIPVSSIILFIAGAYIFYQSIELTGEKIDVLEAQKRNVDSIMNSIN